MTTEEFDLESQAIRNRELCQRARRCWFLTGATASGKTRVSLELARRLDAEIISLDSMAIYRGMDIGTAKPTADQRAQVPHHLIDIVDPVQTFSVSQYREAAHRVIDDLREKGRDVLFVGGTALYLKILLRGMFDGPPADWQLRQQLERELESVPTEVVHERLQLIDPVAAHNLHPNDRRRIIRALEVFRATGHPISHWQMEFENTVPQDRCRVFTLRHPRNLLHERIAERVDWMFHVGLVDEVAGLLERWGELSHTAAQAVGYREVIEHLRGEADLATTREKTLVRTRRFARHQETWFRGLEECQILDLDGTVDATAIAEQIYQLGLQRNVPRITE